MFTRVSAVWRSVVLIQSSKRIFRIPNVKVAGGDRLQNVDIVHKKKTGYFACLLFSSPFRT
jgi:hypothetical protein